MFLEQPLASPGFLKKFRIRETLRLLSNAYSSSKTIKFITDFIFWGEGRGKKKISKGDKKNGV